MDPGVAVEDTGRMVVKHHRGWTLRTASWEGENCVEVETIRINTHLGLVEVSATGRGVCRVTLPDPGMSPMNGREPVTPTLAQARDQLLAYFHGDPVEFTCPLDINGTPFQLRVWEATRNIPLGRTMTYGQVAALAGYPRAARAVGGAMGRNPVPIIVPCHRVVASGGGLGGFGGGLELKRALLNLEGCPVWESRRAW